MKGLAQLAIGLGLLAGGTAKAMHHVAAVDPMAAFWCRTPGVAPAPEAWLFSGHCWGCVAAAMGAAMLLHLALSHVMRGKGATSHPARLRTVESA